MQRAERRQDPLDRMLDAVLLGHVGMHEPDVVTQFRCQLRAHRLIDVGQHDPRARGDKPARARGTQARGATGHQKDMLIELHIQQRTGEAPPIAP